MFYLVEISTGDSKIASRAVYAYDNEKDAVANFHGKLTTAMKSDLYESDLCIVMDENGTVLRREKYNKPISE